MGAPGPHGGESLANVLKPCLRVGGGPRGAGWLAALCRLDTGSPSLGEGSPGWCPGLGGRPM